MWRKKSFKEVLKQCEWHKIVAISREWALDYCIMSPRLCGKTPKREKKEKIGLKKIALLENLSNEFDERF